MNYQGKIRGKIYNSRHLKCFTVGKHFYQDFSETPLSCKVLRDDNFDFLFKSNLSYPSDQTILAPVIFSKTNVTGSKKTPVVSL